MSARDIHLFSLPRKHALTARHFRDIVLSSLADQQMLAYEASSGKWKNIAAIPEALIPVLANTKYPNALLLDGSRPMVGALDMDAQRIKFANVAMYGYGSTYVKISTRDGTATRDLFARRIVAADWVRCNNFDAYTGFEIGLGGTNWFGDVNHIELEEITTPAAVASHGKIYAKSDDQVYFQDGAGNEGTLCIEERANDIAMLSNKHVLHSRIAINQGLILGQTTVSPFFLVAERDANYMVLCSFSYVASYAITGKTVNSFTITFTGAPSGATYDWIILR